MAGRTRPAAQLCVFVLLLITVSKADTREWIDVQVEDAAGNATHSRRVERGSMASYQAFCASLGAAVDAHSCVRQIFAGMGHEAEHLLESPFKVMGQGAESLLPFKVMPLLCRRPP